MISMNISPPRAIDDRNVDSVPKVKARIRNSDSRNIGSAERRSITTKATKRHQRAAEQAEHARARPATDARRPGGCRT